LNLESYYAGHDASFAGAILNPLWLALLLVGGGLLSGDEDHAGRIVAKSIMAGKGGTARLTLKGANVLTSRVDEIDVEAAGFAGRGLPFHSENPKGAQIAIGKLVLHLRDFELGILPVLSVDATISGCRFDRHEALHSRLRITDGGRGTAIVRVDENGLAAFIRTKFPALKKLHVKLGGDRVLLSCEADYLKGHPAVWALGWFAVDGTKVSLSKVDLYIDGLPANAETSGAFLALLNPIVDLDRDLGLEGAAYAKTLTIANGIAEVRGRIRIPGYVSSR
jgi:hypothetical protein